MQSGAPQQAAYPTGALGTGDAVGSTRTTPIANLNPYMSKWTIRARLTMKGEMRSWSNAKGEGNLFSIELLDEHGGEIRGTFFKEQANKFFHQLQEGCVYQISGGRLKNANKQWSSLNHEFEIGFDFSTDIVPVEDDSKIQHTVYSFRKISDIEATEPNTYVDMIGVIKEAADCVGFTSKAGRQLKKRQIVLVDDSNHEIHVTAWGEQAEDGSWQQFTGYPVALKGLKVSDFGGRSLSTNRDKKPEFQPQIPEAFNLAKWWAAGGHGRTFRSISSSGGGLAPFHERKAIAHVVDEHMGFSEKPDVLTAKVTCTFIKHDDPTKLAYPACPSDDCKKKLVQMTEGWHCEKCDKAYPAPHYRYILSLTMMDHTGSKWASAFNQEALEMLGDRRAEDVMNLADLDNSSYEHAFRIAQFEQYICKFRVKSEVVNDEERVKVTIARLEKVDYRAESMNLINAIQSMCG